MRAVSRLIALPFPAAPIAAALGYGLVVSRAADVLLDPDTYWHIATGEWVLRHAAVPQRDPFSFTMAGAPWIDLEWLSEVLMALAYGAGGWNGIVLLTGLAAPLWRRCCRRARPVDHAGRGYARAMRRAVLLHQLRR